MTFTQNDIKTSYSFCRGMSRRAGSNFHAGFLLLSREKRRAMEALYSFMRHTDDLADDTTLESRRDVLTAWRAALQKALQDEEGAGISGQRSGGSDCKSEIINLKSDIPHPSPPALTLTLSQRERGHSILPALADAVRRFHIPAEHLFAVIDGVEMDLDRRRFETFDELQQYCERVASAVGLACIHIWGFRGPEAFEPARQAGIALQLTNILRDLKEDADAGRVYLPLDDLQACGYTEADLRAGMVDERFYRLMAEQIARAERFYTVGAELVEWLDPSGRRIFGLMMATYHALLRKIARRPAEVFRRRVRLGRLKKIQIAARLSLLPMGTEGGRGR